MTRRSFEGIALELALQAAGHRAPRLSQVGAAWGNEDGPPTRVDHDPIRETPLRVDTQTEGYGILILDVTWTTDGKLRLIEANGSNAALTSSIIGKDDARAHHMFLAYKNRRKPSGSVVSLHAYQSGLIHMAEFFGRAALFAEQVSESQTTRFCDSVEDFGDEEVSVVCGAITDLAKHITRDNRRLLFKGRPVVFGTNPNLLAELVRKNIIGRAADDWYDIDTDIYHDGKLAKLVHDKGIQQKVAAGSGIEPLKYANAYSIEECSAVLKGFWKDGLVAVGKMNAGSGGAGIGFFPPSRQEQAEERLAHLIDSAVKKHGNEVTKSMFPIRFFEFAESTHYSLYGADHLWDLRIQCLVYPGYVEVTPCVIRLCPQPFDSAGYSWETVVSNLTGRNPETRARFMRSPAAMRRSKPGVTVLDSIGISRGQLGFIEKSCAKYCENAWLYQTQA